MSGLRPYCLPDSVCLAGGAVSGTVSPYPVNSMCATADPVLTMRRISGVAESETSTVPVPLPSFPEKLSAGWPATVMCFRLAVAALLTPPKPPASLPGLHRAARLPSPLLCADTFRYLPPSSCSTAGLLPPNVFQNFRSGLSQTVLPIMIRRNEPLPCKVMVPVQPVPRIRVMSSPTSWPELTTSPVTWTALAVRRSPTARLSIWPALSVASGSADAVALAPAAAPEELPPEPQAVAPTPSTADRNTIAGSRVHRRLSPSPRSTAISAPSARCHQAR